MKRKKYWIWLMALLFLLSFGGCGGTEASYKTESYESEDDTAWKTAESDEVICLENGDIRLRFQTDTTHFSVENLRSQMSVDSYFCEEPLQTYADEVMKRMNSEVMLVFYEEQSSAQYMFSASDSVAQGSYRVVYNEHCIRVYYTFGATEESTFIPHIFSEEMFEKFADTLRQDVNPDGAAMARRLQRFYTLQTKDTASAKIKEQYPDVKERNLYIINDAESEANIQEVVSYMKVIGYSLEDYQSDLHAEGLEEGETADSPGFVIPIEYSVNEDGFTARILADRVEELSETYKLQSVTMLEYLGGSENMEGQFFVPDGSGAVIDWKADHVSAFSQAFYGADYSIQNERKTQLTQNMCLPVYGISKPKGGILTIVEEGAENGILHAENLDCSAVPNHIYTMFTMRHMDTTDIGADQLIPVYNLFVKERTASRPTQRYVLLPGEACSWSDMAKYTREYLILHDAIKKNEVLDTPVYLTYLGMYRKDANILGIPYDKKVVLSTLNGIEQNVEWLQENGVGDAVIRLDGFSGQGLTPKVNDRFGLYRKSGSKDELKALYTMMNESGGQLYWNGDFTFVYEKGNGFRAKDDSAHYLNRVLVHNGNYDIVTREYSMEKFPRYFVSPSRYLEYVKRQLKDISEELGERLSVSYGKAGMYLGGDYTAKAPVDRTTALQYLCQTLDFAQEKTKNLCFDYGNAYVLPYASALYNMPLQASDFDIERTSVPFYQMVIHGMVPYTGTSLNLSCDQNEAILRTIECGAAFSYTVITGQSSLLVGTGLETAFYSVNSDENLESFGDIWSRYGDFYRAVAKEEMTGHEKIADKVFCTSYANGYRAYVNYGDVDYSVNEIMIKARDFTLVTGGEKK